MPPKKPVVHKPAAKTTAAKRATKAPASNAKATPTKTPVTKAKTAPTVSNATATTVPEPELACVTVTIKGLDGAIASNNSNKWPLILDPSGRTGTLLRYRDSVYLEALSAGNMERETIRLGILGAMRYNKPLVLDMMDVDVLDACLANFDNVMPGLMDAILDRSILKEEVYSKLVQESDPDEFKYLDLTIPGFAFYIVSSKESPPTGLVGKTALIKIETET